jgi:hypothetical protein
MVFQLKLGSVLISLNLLGVLAGCSILVGSFIQDAKASIRKINKLKYLGVFICLKFNKFNNNYFTPLLKY